MWVMKNKQAVIHLHLIVQQFGCIKSTNAYNHAWYKITHIESDDKKRRKREQRMRDEHESS